MLLTTDKLLISNAPADPFMTAGCNRFCLMSNSTNNNKQYFDHENSSHLNQRDKSIFQYFVLSDGKPVSINYEQIANWEFVSAGNRKKMCNQPRELIYYNSLLYLLDLVWRNKTNENFLIDLLLKCFNQRS